MVILYDFIRELLQCVRKVLEERNLLIQSILDNIRELLQCVRKVLEERNLLIQSILDKLDAL